MADTDRQRVSKSSSDTKMSSSAADDAHPKDPASREADHGLPGTLKSIGSAAVAAAAGLKTAVLNDTEVHLASHCMFLAAGLCRASHCTL